MSSETTQTGTKPETPTEKIDRVVIRFAGDSGDGMQLTGTQFTNTTALLGNDLATLPDYPAEIRAPAGTLPGVSAYQINFSAFDIMTPGDSPDVLVAMNPAALKVNLPELKQNAVIIANASAFDKSGLDKAHYDSNPLEDRSLSGFRVYPVDLTRLTREALADTGLTTREVDRCKNFFALGMMYWLYHRPLEPTISWLEQKFKSRPAIAEANTKVLKAGYNYCDITGVFQVSYEIEPAPLKEGTYRNLSGNHALALGLVAAAARSGRRLFLGSYPITPASDILHHLSRFKNYGVITFQAEDEIAAVGAALGASFAGDLGVTTTSGPGLDLKSETMGLAVMAELPLLVVDVQRAGPSTGLPTKTEQADLLHAMYGRHGEAPVPILAACTPSDCFQIIIDAAHIALKYMTPVIVLTDGYLANGAEPWRIPEVEDLPEMVVEPRTNSDGWEGPFMRDPETLARPWVLPGTPGMEHRIGGLEHDHITGNVSYDSANHEEMVRTRAEKVERVVADVPDVEFVEGDGNDDLLVVGWGSTYGAITQAVQTVRENGAKVACLHLRHMNPFPQNLRVVLDSFDKILIPEMNMGQLSTLIKSKYLIDNISFTKIQGQPFKVSELTDRIEQILSEESK